LGAAGRGRGAKDIADCKSQKADSREGGSGDGRMIHGMRRHHSCLILYTVHSGFRSGRYTRLLGNIAREAGTKRPFSHGISFSLCETTHDQTVGSAWPDSCRPLRRQIDGTDWLPISI
jgi:hypothetical protein